MTKRFTTKDDAIQQDILPALGEFADSHDIDGIFAETFEYKVDVNDKGQENLNTAGFEQIVDTDTFWTIVEKHGK